MKGKGKAPGPPPTGPCKVSQATRPVLFGAKLEMAIKERQAKELATYAENEKDEIEIENVDMDSIDASATQERTQCARCEKMVLVSAFDSHMECHSTEILPWLFLGGRRNADNVPELTLRTGITHILNVAAEIQWPDKVCEEFLEHNKERGMPHTLEDVYCRYAFTDDGRQDILPQLNDVLGVIQGWHLANPEHHVLVHCVQGISRSATVVISYLMLYEGMSLRDAHAKVKGLRPQAAPRREFVDQLGTYECKLFSLDCPTFTGEEAFRGVKMLNLDT